MAATIAPTETPVSTMARSGKSQAAFRTISEVADELDVAQHVLRFWESKFPQVRPLKRGGGRRYYRPEDVDLLRDIRSLLYDEGYTIKGAQKLLRQRRAKTPPATKPADAGNPEAELEGTEPPARVEPAPAVTAPTNDQGEALRPPATGDPSAPAGPVAQPGAVDADELAKLEQLRAELQALRKSLDDALDTADH